MNTTMRERKGGGEAQSAPETSFPLTRCGKKEGGGEKEKVGEALLLPLHKSPSPEEKRKKVERRRRLDREQAGTSTNRDERVTVAVRVAGQRKKGEKEEPMSVPARRSAR